MLGRLLEGLKRKRRFNNQTKETVRAEESTLETGEKIFDEIVRAEESTLETGEKIFDETVRAEESTPESREKKLDEGAIRDVVRKCRIPTFASGIDVETLSEGVQLTEEQQQVVIDNVRIFFEAFINDKYRNSGIATETRLPVNDSTPQDQAERQPVVIRYQTDSGKIGGSLNAGGQTYDNDWSKYLTSVITRRVGFSIDWSKNPSFSILLTTPDGELTLSDFEGNGGDHALDQVLASPDDLPEQPFSDDKPVEPKAILPRIILPQRISVDDLPNQTGDVVVLSEFSPEDWLVLISMHVFNLFFAEQKS